MRIVKQITRTGGYAVIKSSENILLCQLTRSRMWTLPGGGVEFGEDPSETMIREVQEETGFAVRNLGLLGVNSHVAMKPDEIHSIYIIYSAEIIGGEMRSEEEGTTDQCAWHSWESAGSLNPSPSLRFVLNHFESVGV